MPFLIASLMVAAIPFAVERFYFAKRFGLFAALFWLFIFQASVMAGGAVVARQGFGDALPGWINAVGHAIGAFAYLTIGITPIVAALAAATAGVVIAARSLPRREV